MDYVVTAQTIRVVGGLAFLFILYSLWMGRMTVQGLPAGYTNPVLALELVADGRDLKTIVSADERKAATFIRQSTHKDFGFIPVYALTFAAVSLLLGQTSAGRIKYLGGAAVVCVVLAALFDLAENRGMLRALNGGGGDTLANSIRYPSLAKWALLFIVSLIVGLLLAARRDLFLIPAAIFLFGGALGWYGVIANLLQPRYYWTFLWALNSLGLGILILAVAFTVWPRKLLLRTVPRPV